LATIYAPNGRNRRNVFDNGLQKPLNGFAPNSHGRRAWSFEYQGQKSKAKVTRDRNALCIDNTPAVWTEWNALVADNAKQAANATSRLLKRRVFAAMRALDLAGYRWALPRICSYGRPM